jgi:hypothetical protein
MRRILAGHSQKKIGKSVGPLVFISYARFVEDLMQQAQRKAKADGEARIAARDIRKVTLAVLRKYKG